MRQIARRASERGTAQDLLCKRRRRRKAWGRGVGGKEARTRMLPAAAAVASLLLMMAILADRGVIMQCS